MSSQLLDMARFFSEQFRTGKLRLDQLQYDMRVLSKTANPETMRLLASIFSEAAEMEQSVPDNDVDACSTTTQRRNSRPYKVKPCKYVYNPVHKQFNPDDSACRHGANCRFAHTWEELERHRNI